MKHIIMGVPKGEDFPSFEAEIPITLPELTKIMGWADEGDCIYDYRLTAQQITEIESVCSLALPKDLDLFLTCSA